MISSVTNQGKVRWMVYRGSFNAVVFIKFMSRLIKDAKRKIILIVDNLRVHHRKPVKAWVAQRANKIALAFLPSYSPEHNLDGSLNCDLKSAMVKKPSPRTPSDLEGNLKPHMRMLSKSPERATSYFEAKSIRYASAA